MIEALDIQIKGIVQGVGFRPFVYRLAKRHLINGWVLNAIDGVRIHAEGETKLLDEFVAALAESDGAPNAAHVTSIEMQEVPLEDCESFEILLSDEAQAEQTTLVSPDLATCDDCVRELFSTDDRRFRYPFINCTNCGPRFTIIEELPYDRASTSMRDFDMCDRCAAEYADPTNRRFHAQPNACFACGPHVSWRERAIRGRTGHDRMHPGHAMRKDAGYEDAEPRQAECADAEPEQVERENAEPWQTEHENAVLEDARHGHADPGYAGCEDAGPENNIGREDAKSEHAGCGCASRENVSRETSDCQEELGEVAWGITREQSDAIFARAVELLLEGKIIAVKGLGGFHLVCDARNSQAVAALRSRKLREGKPFAVMMADVEAARSVCRVNDVEAAVLEGPQRPIVLLRKRPGAQFAARLADGLSELGIMLPCTPVQHILMHDFAKAASKRLKTTDTTDAADATDANDANDAAAAAVSGCPSRAADTSHVPMLVMTSGNVHDEPIVIDDEAYAKLGGIADAFLGNDRAICTRFDDSVVRVIEAGDAGHAVQFVRRARGYAPVPIDVSKAVSSTSADVQNVSRETFESSSNSQRDAQCEKHPQNVSRETSPASPQAHCRGEDVGAPPESVSRETSDSPDGTQAETQHGSLQSVSRETFEASLDLPHVAREKGSDQSVSRETPSASPQAHCRVTDVGAPPESVSRETLGYVESPASPYGQSFTESVSRETSDSPDGTQAETQHGNLQSVSRETLTPDLFATGPEQKNTFTMLRGAEAFVSQHIGDMENVETFDAWLEAKRRYETLFEMAPRMIACDMHPEYLTSKWAHKLSAVGDSPSAFGSVAHASFDASESSSVAFDGSADSAFSDSAAVPVVEVQHHHAHIVSVMAEHGLRDAVCGIAFDGTGYGVNGAIWGGEVLLANLRDFERFANFAYVPMPGGAAAIEHPLRMAYGVLWAYDLLDHPAAQSLLTKLGDQADVCEAMIENGLNTPMTSSVGRLFDAASALLGVCTEPRYEGEGAVLLEACMSDTEYPENTAIETKNVSRETFEAPLNLPREARGAEGNQSASHETSHASSQAQCRGTDVGAPPENVSRETLGYVESPTSPYGQSSPENVSRETSGSSGGARTEMQRGNFQNVSRETFEAPLNLPREARGAEGNQSASHETSHASSQAQCRGTDVGAPPENVSRETFSDAEVPTAQDGDALGGDAWDGDAWDGDVLDGDAWDDGDASGRYAVDVVKNAATKESTAQDTSVVLFDAQPTFRALLDDLAAGIPTAVIARRFHDAIADAIAVAAELVRALYGIDTIVLSGGVFMNRYLIERTIALLGERGFTVAVNRDLPPNDGCLSLGQAVVAWTRTGEREGREAHEACKADETQDAQRPQRT